MAGIFLVLAVVTLIFAKEYISFLVAVVWAFAVMAFFAMFFAYKASKKK